MRLPLALILVSIACFSAVSGRVEAIPKEAIRTQNVKDICTTKTSTLRDVPESVKRDVYMRDGIPGGNHTGICDGPRGCEADHRVALWDGGANTSDKKSPFYLSNLVVMPYFGPCSATDKDALEVKLHKLICTGKIPVATAQSILYDDWITGYKIYVNAKGCGL